MTKRLSLCLASGLAAGLATGFAFTATTTLAQTIDGSDTITVSAEVVEEDQAPLEVSGQSANFGRLFIPKGAANVCVYVIDEKGDPRVEGESGTSNPEPGHCQFADGIAPPIFTITGEPNSAFQTRLIAETSSGAVTAQLKLLLEDGSNEFVYPHFQDDKGVFSFSPRIQLQVPATASEFAAGDIGTLTAEVSY